MLIVGGPGGRGNLPVCFEVPWYEVDLIPKSFREGQGLDGLGFKDFFEALAERNAKKMVVIVVRVAESANKKSQAENKFVGPNSHGRILNEFV